MSGSRVASTTPQLFCSAQKWWFSFSFSLSLLLLFINLYTSFVGCCCCNLYHNAISNSSATITQAQVTLTQKRININIQRASSAECSGVAGSQWEKSAPTDGAFDVDDAIV